MIGAASRPRSTTTPNINEGGGALHPKAAGLRRRHGAQLGIALDGDADRGILVDERGEVVDGSE